MEGDEARASGAAELVERLAGFVKAAGANAKEWRAAGALARRLTGSAIEDLAGVRRAAAALGKLALPEARLLGEALLAYATHEEEERRFRRAREVVEALRAAGAEPRRVGEDPPVWEAPPLGITLDETRGKAVVSYAREPLAEAPLAAGRIAQLWREARDALTKRARPPAEFREVLLGAYRAVLARAGRAPGERVDLVDLLPEIALVVQGDKFRSDPRKGSFSDYPRAQFAWDLAALVRAGLLSAGGLRLEIGPATMGTTAHKRRVLWLEAGAGGGQYCLSLRFVPDRPEEAP
ncbi:MAG: hypothetical protein HY905_06790 [Deltaproteobacteria bacterium]|nr:hypothetical protein [Deltaproteobacteria bacterium]